MIRDVSIAPYQLPVTIRGRSRQRDGWLLTITARDGQQGVGDAAPWPGFGARTADVRDDLCSLMTSLPGRSVDGLLADANLSADPTLNLDTAEVRHALELALLDLHASRAGLGLCRVLACAPAATVGSHTLVHDAAEAAHAVASGAVALKVKLTGSPDQATAHIAAIAAVAQGVALRLDANGLYSVAQARAVLAGLAAFKLAWVEQPVADLADFRALRGLGVPLAADESVATNSIDAVAELADVVVIKPMFVGGPNVAVRLARRAQKLGRTVCITHALESAVGRMAALHVAAAVNGDHGDRHAIHGVGEPGVVSGQVAVPTAAGLGLARSWRAA